MRGWWAYFAHADWRREVTDLGGWIRRHIRKWFWQRWHHPRGRMNALKRLGIKGRAVRQGWSSRGAWAVAAHAVMQHALNNQRLKRWGLGHPWDNDAAAGMKA